MNEQCPTRCYIEGFSVIGQFLLVLSLYAGFFGTFCMRRRNTPNNRHLVEQNLDQFLRERDRHSGEEYGEGHSEDENDDESDDESDDEGEEQAGDEGENIEGETTGEVNAEETVEETPEETVEETPEETAEEKENDSTLRRRTIISSFFG